MAELIYNSLGRMRVLVSPSLAGVGKFKYRAGGDVMLREKIKTVLHFWGGCPGKAGSSS